MCMMAKNGEKESCEVAKNLAALGGRVDAVEKRMDKIEGSLSVGFTQVNSAISNLANQFGERMNTLDKRIVDEKAKHDERVDANRLAWHDTLRKVVTWTAIVVLSGASVAMGVSIYKNIFVK